MPPELEEHSNITYHPNDVVWVLPTNNAIPVLCYKGKKTTYSLPKGSRPTPYPPPGGNVEDVFIRVPTVRQEGKTILTDRHKDHIYGSAGSEVNRLGT